MSVVFDALAAVRDKLASLEAVNTCRIGLESDMTPDDYPIVRIVPSMIRNGTPVTRRATDVLVYFGEPIHEFSGGIEAQWQSLLDMEQVLREELRAVPGVSLVQCFETVLDEDRADEYKLLAIRATVTA